MIASTTTLPGVRVSVISSTSTPGSNDARLVLYATSSKVLTVPAIVARNLTADTYVESGGAGGGEAGGGDGGGAGGGKGGGGDGGGDGGGKGGGGDGGGEGGGDGGGDGGGGDGGGRSGGMGGGGELV